MKIIVTADLHYDFWARTGRRLFEEQRDRLRDLDALIVAGDLANDPVNNWPGCLEWLSEFLPPEKIWIVPGNHDYYRHRLDADADLNRMCQAAGVNFAQKRSLFFDDVRFLLCTLWSDFAVAGDRSQGMIDARRGLNDYNFISCSGNGGSLRRIEPEDTLGIHRDHLSWLEAELAKPHDGRTVVVTHHCPHPDATGVIDRITPGFTSDLGNTIDRYAPDAWLFGHTHRRLRALRGRTEIRNVSIGYPQETAIGAENILLDRGHVDTERSPLLEPVFSDIESIVRTSSDGLKFVCLKDVPASLRSQFDGFMTGSTCPVIDGFMDVAYAHDWTDFCQRYGVA